MSLRRSLSITLLFIFSSFWIFVGCDSEKKPANSVAKAAPEQEAPSNDDPLQQRPKVVPKNYAATAKLPEGIEWKTNTDFPIFGDPNAQRGGTFRTAISTYPLTFRLYGPNSNAGGFVGYNRKWALMGLVETHPNTREFIPGLATHWALMPDNKTAYFKLDPDARWSDGTKITADDYLFAYEFMQSKEINAPFYNQYIRDHIQSLEKIDDYTLKGVSVRPSWRLLEEISITPLPRHVIKLDKDWVRDANWLVNVVPGPYQLTRFEKGGYLEFSRIKDWWGEKKRQYLYMYNFDTIRLNVVAERESQFEQFRKGLLDFFEVGDVNRWVKQTDFDLIKQGLIQKQRIFVQTTVGMRGIFLNTQNTILKDPKIRRALAHTFDFETINEKLLFGMEVRLHNYFDVYDPYRDPTIRTWSYDLQTANRLLDEAGWVGPRTETGIRTKEGVPLNITISFGNETWIKYLAFLKQSALKAGIDLVLKQRDGSALYKEWGEKSYQATVLAFGGGTKPSPRQMLHTENIAKNSNNMSMFGTAEMDQLIETYEFDMDEKKRIAAIFRIEQIVKENALVIPFWKQDHERLLWWRYLKGPQNFVTKSGADFDYFWYDPKEAARVEAAKNSRDQLSQLPATADPYGLKQE